MKKNEKLLKLIEELVDYVIDTESENYEEYCEELGLNPNKYSKNTEHAFAKAQTIMILLKKDK